MAQWIRREAAEHESLGSNPGTDYFLIQVNSVLNRLKRIVSKLNTLSCVQSMCQNNI